MIKLKSFRVRASYNFQTVEMEFEGDIKPEDMPRLQMKAIRQAQQMAEQKHAIEEEIRKEINLNKEKQYSKKATNNKYM